MIKMDDLKLNIFFIAIGSAFLLYDKYNYGKKSVDEKEKPMNKVRHIKFIIVGGLFFLLGVLKILFLLLITMN